MILALALLTQAVTVPPIRIARTDSTVVVSLRDPGYVTLLQASADGRISVLFPLEPDLDTRVSADMPMQMALPPRAQGTVATFVAIRSRWPFNFAALRDRAGVGSTWDYGRAWLLQPTAGDPLAALLDIAERVTDGRPYDYETIAYQNGGTIATRRTPRQPDVCLSCVRHGMQGVPEAPATATNAVDCTNASLTNSFCGVNSGTVSIATAPAASTSPGPLQQGYQPALYFVPVMRGFHQRFAPPPPASPPPASQGVAFPVPPRLVVPSSTLLRTVTSRRP